MKLYDDLVWRGLIKDISDVEKAKKYLNEDKIKFYCGFDPTGESLTVGHLVQIVRMMLLQKYGHTPIVLIGGATGLVGDPKETSERKLLTVEQSLKNAEKIKVQIKRFLKEEDSIYVNNYDWTKDIDMITFLRDYGKHFNVNYMLAKDTVQKRLETGISYTEFSYMIMQSIDFLNLYRNYDCKLQFGGSDQWGNITAGLELIRKLEGDKNNAFGLSSPLLLKADGTKFGKSETETLWIDKDLTSPYELYQYFINSSDDDIEEYLKQLTLLSKDEIVDALNQHNLKKELRIAQKVLAEEVVTLVHGKELFEQALRVTEALFTGSFNDLSEDDFLELTKTLESTTINEDVNILDLLVDLKLASSKREAREFVKNGAISVNDEKITDFNEPLPVNLAFYNKYYVIRRGRKNYAIAKL